MKKNLLSLLAGTLVFAACTKEKFAPQFTKLTVPCEQQTANPAGHTYDDDSIVVYTASAKYCSILPLSKSNYWVYQDSIFNNGVFVKVQMDTLRFETTYKSLQDGLIWWEGNIDIGLPDRLYANDSAFFKIEDRMFTQDIVDAKKDFSLFPGDSLRYLASFEDNAAQGRSLKLTDVVSTPAGTYKDCLYFEKNARNFRKDQVFFKPGVGVLRYVQEKAPMGSPRIALQQISTLVAYHIE